MLEELGFYKLDDKTYAHLRAPILLTISHGNHCKLSYTIESDMFSHMQTNTRVDRDLILSALKGFKEALTKLGLT